MKSIKDTLRIIRDITSALPAKVFLVLVGGQAVIAQGVEGSTIDVDFCIYSDAIHETNSSQFFKLLSEHLPKRFSARLVQGSKIPDDPLKHDIIFIDDSEGEYERIDLLIARYKWELEGMEQAEHIEGLPIPVLSKPYLAAMKLRATGYKDAADVVALFALMTEEEKKKTFALAKQTGREKKLTRLLNPLPEEVNEMPPEEYL
jgi:hypothetical protein